MVGNNDSSVKKHGHDSRTRLKDSLMGLVVTRTSTDIFQDGKHVYKGAIDYARINKREMGFFYGNGNERSQISLGVANYDPRTHAINISNSRVEARQ